MKTISHGSFGKVLKLKNIAIKQLLPLHHDNQIFVKRFSTEYIMMKTLSGLYPLGFPQVKTLDKQKNEFSMELFNEGGLDSFLDKLTESNSNYYKNILVKRILDIFMFIESQTSYPYLLHCDIKPNNFIVNIDHQNKSNIRVALTDFGIATFLGIDSEISVNYESMGSNDFIHPDVYYGKEDPSIKYEIYSVLRVFNYILNGNAVENFSDEIWLKYNSGEINDFKSLAENINPILISDDFSVAVDDSQKYLELDWENIENTFNENFNNFNSFKNLEEFIIENNNSDGEKLIKLILNNYKKIWYFPIYSSISKLLYTVIQSSRYEDEIKLECFNAIEFCANEKNCWSSKNIITNLKTSRDLRILLSPKLVEFIDEEGNPNKDR